MRLVMHQALKDLWLFRWLLLAWLGLLGVLHALVLYGTTRVPLETIYGIYERSAGDPIATTFNILSAVVVGGFVAIAVLVVQTDPGAGTNAFWFTRPISASSVLLAKLVVLVPVFVIIPVLADALVLFTCGISSAGVWRAMIYGFATQIGWLLPAMALAAFTNGLAQFVLAALFEALALSGLTWVTRMLWMASTWRFVNYSPTYTIVSVAMLVIVSAALIVFVYASRSTRRSYVFAAAAPVIVTLTAAMVAPSAQTLTIAESRDSSGIRVSVQPNPITVTRAADGSCTFDAYFVVSNLAPKEVLTAVRGSASVRASATRVNLFASASDVMPGRPALIARATGARVIPGGKGDAKDEAGARPVALRGYAPPGRCAELREGFGRLEVDMELTTHEYTATQADLVKGSKYPVGDGWGKVVSVQRTTTGLDFTLQNVQGDLASAIGLWSDYALYNGHRHEALQVYGHATLSNRFGAVFFPIPQHLSSRVEQYGVVWPRATDFDQRAWMRDAKLVIVRPTDRRVVQRHVNVGDVPIVAQTTRGN